MSFMTLNVLTETMQGVVKQYSAQFDYLILLSFLQISIYADHTVRTAEALLASEALNNIQLNSAT